MFKFGTIGAYKQVRNNPRGKAKSVLLDGMTVIPDRILNESPVPATPAQAKGDVYVAGNIIDKPEIRNSKDFKIEIGEYVRSFRLSDLAGLPVELDYRIVKDAYQDVNVKDVLVSTNVADDGVDAGKWKKVTIAEAADYKVKLLVIEKTSFGDKGFYCEVVTN
ncbi:hypothetical protein G7L40_00525 [Paenibacillus polymyxa]|uniref:Uncharacterized protein n=1 Tax=Paenibacillus polymyxa TaxID=1406 RepID=A0A378XXD0_PAEPO|nr:hypothetical protein [Paenibacillus polymyxa]MBE7897195.1 hypothetical protein [Paenibacillus polymyxa]MBG9763050.1 hypothetical protein [Paenibacillus polymyxa]MCC3257555.1 hypothetical protein [Paenibacillus polymyxa]QPK51359.1 hypothetical protein G7035_00525 [Paenibacillus polymyxa]QPK56449.1 hypothetical protein G7L40_00525 [Paenibacillus polymyxa]